MITFEDNYFFLTTANSSYIMRVLPDKTINHCYYGKRINPVKMDNYNLFIPHDYTAPLAVGKDITTPDAIPQECPSYGRGDYRSPAVVIETEDGRTVNDFKFIRHRHYSGATVIPELPCLDCNTDFAETLEIVLYDSATGINIHLFYTVFEDIDIIARSISVVNKSSQEVTVRRLMSASLDFESRDFDMISLSGRWACERSLERVPLRYGTTCVSSCRGATGHDASPFAALAAKNTDEEHGEVYGMTLIYSGNFEIGAQVGQFGGVRLFGGINHETFSWYLKEGETLMSPQALLTYTDKGFSTMSRNFHRACKGHLGVCSENKKHPVVLNLWEAFYFDVSEEKMISAIRAVKDTGIDTVVLDDGWFGKRIDDSTSLGDWYANPEKFPEGFGNIIAECKACGLKFGLWFEPESISEDSDLYRKHPDWCIRIKREEPVKSRNELVLDFSRKEVVDGVYKLVSRVIRNNSVSYVKWDMNRNITDHGSDCLDKNCQGEFFHRYIIGVYALMYRLIKRFPDVFFEGCAGGGGRFDFGILYFMSQIWTSDNTDAISRLKIQYGTSFVFPAETMSAHVSACPNHQTGRVTPLETRANVAQLFSFGYEFDPCAITDETRESIVEQIKRHKDYDEWLGKSDFYRLISPFSTDRCAWMSVSEDKEKAVFMYAVRLADANPCGEYVRLKGLDPNKRYRIWQTSAVFGGDHLMNAGIPIKECNTDFRSILLDIEAI